MRLLFFPHSVSTTLWIASALQKNGYFENEQMFIIFVMNKCSYNGQTEIVEKSRECAFI